MFSHLIAWYQKIRHLVALSLPKTEQELDVSPFFPHDDHVANEQVKHISPLVARTFWWVGALVVVICYAIFQAGAMLYLIITWFIVSLAIERLILFRQRIGCGRGFALWLSYLLLVLFMLSGMLIMIPFVINQLVSLGEVWFQALQHLQTQIQANGLVSVVEQTNLPTVIKTWFAAQATEGERVVLLQSVVTDNMSQIATVGGESLKSAWSLAVSIVNGTFSVLIQIVLVLTIAIFFSVERKAVFVFIAKLTNKPARTYKILQHLSTKLWVWLEGQLLLCLIIGVCVLCGLRLLSIIWFDLPNKFSLALIAWLTEFLPYIWPLLWWFPALLVAMLAFWWQWMVATLLLYRAIQQTENNIIVPAVMSQKLSVNPLVIFLCMLLGATLFGFLGVLLAVPLAVIVSILVATLYGKEDEIDD